MPGTRGLSPIIASYEKLDKFDENTPERNRLEQSATDEKTQYRIKENRDTVN